MVLCGLSVFLGPVVFALLMMVGGLKVMMRSGLVMCRGLKVLLDCFRLRLGGHVNKPR